MSDRDTTPITLTVPKWMFDASRSALLFSIDHAREQGYTEHARLLSTAYEGMGLAADGHEVTA